MILKQQWIRDHWMLLFLVLVSQCLFIGAAGSDLLKYDLKAKPGDLTVDRMPPTGPKSYEEEFVFTVTNPRKMDFNGTAPTSQKFDVEVFFMGVDKKTSVWKWSAGKVFSQIVTPVPIPAGKSWSPEEKVVWTFKAADVKDGKYRAVASFIPTKNKSAFADFTISSVH